MFISIVGCSKNENESSPTKTDHSSETVENLYTSIPSEYQPDIPPQPLAFISIDKAKDFILNPKYLGVNFIKLENKHYDTIRINLVIQFYP